MNKFLNKIAVDTYTPKTYREFTRGMTQDQKLQWRKANRELMSRITQGSVKPTQQQQYGYDFGTGNPAVAMANRNFNDNLAKNEESDLSNTANNSYFAIRGYNDRFPAYFTDRGFDAPTYELASGRSSRIGGGDNFSRKYVVTPKQTDIMGYTGVTQNGKFSNGRTELQQAEWDRRAAQRHNYAKLVSAGKVKGAWDPNVNYTQMFPGTYVINRRRWEPGMPTAKKYMHQFLGDTIGRIPGINHYSANLPANQLYFYDPDNKRGFNRQLPTSSGFSSMSVIGFSDKPTLRHELQGHGTAQAYYRTGTQGSYSIAPGFLGGDAGDAIYDRNSFEYDHRLHVNVPKKTDSSTYNTGNHYYNSLPEATGNARRIVPLLRGWSDKRGEPWNDYPDFWDTYKRAYNTDKAGLRAIQVARDREAVGTDGLFEPARTLEQYDRNIAGAANPQERQLWENRKRQYESNMRYIFNSGRSIPGYENEPAPFTGWEEQY